MSVEVTRMSRNGQVVIPKKIRDRLRLRPGEPLIASDIEGRIVMAPAKGEAIRAEFEEVIREFDRRLGKAGRRADPIELVRRLREEGAGR